MGMWRNGRREGLKIPWQQCRVGSTPTIPTTLHKVPIDARENNTTSLRAHRNYRDVAQLGQSA